MKKHLLTPTVIKVKRAQGFLRRMSTRKSRQIINRRRRKGRYRLTI